MLDTTYASDCRLGYVRVKHPLFAVADYWLRLGW